MLKKILFCDCLPDMSKLMGCRGDSLLGQVVFLLCGPIEIHVQWEYPVDLRQYHDLMPGTYFAKGI